MFSVRDPLGLVIWEIQGFYIRSSYLIMLEFRVYLMSFFASLPELLAWKAISTTYSALQTESFVCERSQNNPTDPPSTRRRSTFISCESGCILGGLRGSFGHSHSIALWLKAGDSRSQCGKLDGRVGLCFCRCQYMPVQPNRLQSIV